MPAASRDVCVTWQRLAAHWHSTDAYISVWMPAVADLQFASPTLLVKQRWVRHYHGRGHRKVGGRCRHTRSTQPRSTNIYSMCLATDPRTSQQVPQHPNDGDQITTPSLAASSCPAGNVGWGWREDQIIGHFTTCRGKGTTLQKEVRTQQQRMTP
jgi:hypothetical protein